MMSQLIDVKGRKTAVIRSGIIRIRAAWASGFKSIWHCDWP